MFPTRQSIAEKFTDLVCEKQKVKEKKIKAWAIGMEIKGRSYIDVRSMHGWKTGAKNEIERLKAQGRTSKFIIIPCEVSYKLPNTKTNGICN